MALPAFIRVQSGGICLAVKVQPRSSKNEIGEALGNELKIRVTAPPVDSAANEALIRLLAEHLECSRSQVELVRGHTSRRKLVKIHGMSAETLLSKLNVP